MFSLQCFTSIFQLTLWQHLIHSLKASDHADVNIIPAAASDTPVAITQSKSSMATSSQDSRIIHPFVDILKYTASITALQRNKLILTTVFFIIVVHLRRFMGSRYKKPERREDPFDRKSHGIDPSRLKLAMSGKQAKYMGLSQQDAQEFFSDFMGILDQETIELLDETFLGKLADQVSFVSTPSPSTVSMPPKTENKTHSAVEESWRQLNSENVSPNKSFAAFSSDAGATGLKAQGLRKLCLSAFRVLVPSAFCFESIMSMHLQCSQCSFQHEPKYEVYRDFSLDIVGSEGIDGDSLEDLIKLFLQPETRDLFCPQCQSHCQVIIHKQMVQLAPVIVLHLKRFQYHAANNEFVKSSTSVRFPKRLNLKTAGLLSSSADECTRGSISLVKSNVSTMNQYKSIYNRSLPKNSAVNKIILSEMLDLHSKLSVKEDSSAANGVQSHSDSEVFRDYTLMSVVRHFGLSLGSGHYVSDVYNPAADGVVTPSWLRYNDSFVNSIEEVSGTASIVKLS